MQAKSINKNESIKVLFVAGAGRSGSTLLALKAGQFNGFFNAGEIRYVFSKKMQDRHIPCSCGNQITECGFWKKIINTITPATVSYATRTLTSKNFPTLIFGKRKNSSQLNQWQNLQIVGSTVYSRIKLQSNTSILIDSSKHPSYGFFLSQVPNIEFYVLHLVRDARGVAYSWMRAKEYLGKRHFLNVTREWIVYNIEAEILQFFAKDYIRINFETFIRDPDRCLESVLEILDIQPEKSQENMLNEHSLAGNPSKFDNTAKINTFHAKWSLPPHLNFIITLLCWPLLIRYGYLKKERSTLLNVKGC